MIYNSREKFHTLFEDAPLCAAIFDASDMKLEVVNKPMLDLWHRPSSIKGTALLDFLPELADQEYPELMKRVIKTGKTHKEEGARILLQRNAKLEAVFIDYSYVPILMDRNRTSAILVMATDVCDRELNKLNLQQSKRDLRALVMSAPIPMCIYRGEEFDIEAVNDWMMDLWQGKHFKDLAALQHVFFNGLPYTCKHENIVFNYTPLNGGANSINAICLTAMHC